MIAAETVAVVLLAAGLSTRFCARDKLAESLDGLPLGLHVARTLGSLPFAAKIVVTRASGPDFRSYGFATVLNPDPGAGQSRSIALGVAQARLAKPGAILIALADMPFIPIAHVQALLDRFDEHHPVVASTAGQAPSPPTLFGASLFDALETVNGDQGARHLLRNAALVTTPPSVLIDIDTPRRSIGARDL